MNTRLKIIIDYVAKGKHAEFARMMDWSPQYLNSMVSGKGSIGLAPVAAILRRFPDIDARWLILGQGAMLHPDIIERTKRKLKRLQELERYLPAMTLDELQQYGNGRTDFDDSTLVEWERKMSE